MTTTRPPETTSFLASPVTTDLDAMEADFAVIGIPHGVPYDPAAPATAAAQAPRAVRERSARYGAFREHHDFDSGGPLLPASVRVVDVGDAVTPAGERPGPEAAATRAVAALLARGAVPVVLGGDDSTPAFALAAYQGFGPVTVVQVDAHIDYRDEVGGERWGYSSPMRRAAEMPWVEKVVHVGARGVGSARREELEATLARGNAVVTAREVHERGVAAALAHVPEGGRYYVAVDVDGFDPAVMPGTAAAAPGGLTYWHGLDLLRGLCERGRLAGIGFAEYYPDRDVNGLTALGIVRLGVAAMAGARR
ncbi:MAG TPA: arginase family protein [Trueperaceae bacterium]